MRASNFAGALALIFALSGAARAQEQGGLKPTDGTPPPAPALAPGAPTPAADPVAPPPNTPQAPATADTPTVDGANKDPGGWKGQAPAPPPAGVPQAGDPLSGPAALGGAAAPVAPAPVDPAQEEAERKKNDRIIENNYGTAIKIYEDELKNDGESAENLDHRIQTNEKLIAKYKAALGQANEVKRRQQVELFNRTFYLKQQRDKGAIPDDTFEKLMKSEEKKYNEKTQQARSDIEFYEKEIADAEKRLNDLRAERRIAAATNTTNLAANGKPKQKPKPHTAVVVDTLKSRLQRLSEFEPKHTMDGAPVCEPCMSGTPSAPPAAGAAPTGPPAGAPGGGN
jgi:hypothetical protein